MRHSGHNFWHAMLASIKDKFRALFQDPVCNHCQCLMAQAEQGLFCVKCMELLSVRDAFPLTRTAHTATYAATLFNPQNRRLIYGHKFQGLEKNADCLTHLLVAYWEKVLENAPADLAEEMRLVRKGYPSAITVVPIPSHLEEAGKEVLFKEALGNIKIASTDSTDTQLAIEKTTNHLHPIAEAFARYFGYAYEPDLLNWNRIVTPQHTLSGKKRRFSNVQGGMSVRYQQNPKTLLTTRRILLVDDIHTSGATLHEASQAFLRCPVYDGAVTGLALTYMSLAFQKNRALPINQVLPFNTDDSGIGHYENELVQV